MGLFLRFRWGPSPRIGDIADDGLPALVDMHMHDIFLVLSDGPARPDTCPQATVATRACQWRPVKSDWGVVGGYLGNAG
jgi:hypothetical protein